ncbi:MAG TPA: serine/threonine-protein kinase [Planctomycetaceae bacterium]|nr:serine/threonine-protein kinase [Planctomycetaceae bacterium]
MSEGELVVDGYRLVNCIAQGNHSDVWEVRDPAGGQFAMKLLKPEAMEDRAQVQTLKHEARVSKLLDHPNFVKFQKSAFTKQHAYLLMEFFRAPNVKTQIMNDLAGLHVRFRKLVEHVCLVLQFMHDKGWVHRDLKPENILVNKASELRLIDFSLSTRAAGGLAGLLGGKAKVIQGTRTYIAPETIRKKPATPRTDTYSLGVTLFEILTGRPPFKAPSPDELLKQHLQMKPPAPSDFHRNVTPEMDRLVLRMLEKKPDKRPKSMNEVYAEFRALKPFVEDPQELYDREEAARRERDLDGLRSADSVLNSRADADRRAAGIVAPARKGKAQKVQAAEVYREGQAVAASAAPEPTPAGPPMPAYPPQPGPYPYPPQPYPPYPPGFQQPPMWPQPGWPQPPYPGYAGPAPPEPALPGPGMPPGAPHAPPSAPVPPAAPIEASSPPAVEPTDGLQKAAASPRAPEQPRPAPAARPAPERRAAKPASSAALPGSGMVLSFEPEPAGAAVPRPAATAAAGTAASASRPGQAAAAPAGTEPGAKPGAAGSPADRPATAGDDGEDDLPFMDELPEVI